MGVLSADYKHKIKGLWSYKNPEWEFRGSKERTKTTKYMDFGAAKDHRVNTRNDFTL